MSNISYFCLTISKDCRNGKKQICQKNSINLVFWWLLTYDIKQANSENCGPPHGNKFDLEKVKGEGQGRTDRQTPDKVIFMCRYASQVTQQITYV